MINFKKKFMIKKLTFEKIKNEVETAINQAFDELKRLNPNNYALYFMSIEICNGIILLEDRRSDILDSSRLHFLQKFMENYYTFDNEDKTVHDDAYRFNLEMMIYTHCWESDYFLKKLRKLCQLLDGEEYNFYPIDIPVSKKEWIKESIYNILIKKNLKLGKIISQRYDQHLRNSFAHSSYSIDVDQRLIKLHKKQKDVSFNQWNKYFAYTFWLSFLLPQVIIQRTKNLTKDLKTEEFLLRYYLNEKEYSCTVKYNKSSECFFRSQKTY